MASNLGKTQAQIEAQLLEVSRRQSQASLSPEEIVGDPEEWLLPLGPYRLLLNPLDQHWWYYDQPHEAWRDSYYRAGQVTFSLRGDEIDVLRTDVAQPEVATVVATAAWTLTRVADGKRALPLGAETLIGRGGGNHVLLQDDLASRRHAVIRRQGEGYTIEDLGSRNGTFVNGARIAAPTALRPGDTITIGSTQLVVHAEQRT